MSFTLLTDFGPSLSFLSLRMKPNIAFQLETLK